MASYVIPNLPYTFTPDATACDYTYSDGFKIEFKAGTFAQSTSLTISSPVKKAFFLRENSSTDKTYIECAGNYYKITRNNGVAPSLKFKVTLPHKAQFTPDNTLAKFNVYYCDQATVEEDDPGNWHPCEVRSGAPSGGYFAGETLAFGFFMVAHKVNGRDDY